VFQTSRRLRREETHLRDDFIALVAHELGNPVAALELATERLDMTRRAARTVDARLSEDVRACTLTLRRIVTDLLDTSRVHARRSVIS
jgi:signal transduction histidine kinase